MNKLVEMLKKYPLYTYIGKLGRHTNRDARRLSTSDANQLDYLSIYSDWQTVGDDLRSSMYVSSMKKEDFN